MKGIKSWTHRKLFWVGLAIIVLLVGARIAWVEYTHRSPYYFAKRKTSFLLLGKPYQPNWEPEYQIRYRGTPIGRRSPRFSSREHSWKPPTTGQQTLIEDSLRASLGRDSMHISTTVSCYLSQDGLDYWISFDSDDIGWGRSGACATPEYDEDTRILTVQVVETFRNVSRKATFKFRLTKDGFVVIVDGEGRVRERPH